MGYYITSTGTTIEASTPVYHSSLADKSGKTKTISFELQRHQYKNQIITKTKTNSFLDFMDQNVISVDVLQRKLRVLNQKEDRSLQQKLNMLEKQYRYTHKMLQQRRDSLMSEHRRLTLVKICEPKATVNVAMREIGEQQRAEMHLRATQTREGRRFYSSKYHNEGSNQVEQGRSISAPLPPPVKPASPVIRRGFIQSSLSLMQMKNIANIDSISEKELARQQRKTREEMERMKELQREMLQKKVTAFIEMLKDRSNTYRESPYRNVMGND